MGEISVSATGVLINLLGGITLLLWGLHVVRTGVTRAFGSRIRTILGRSLSNRFKAFLTGLGVTVLLQSSSASALLTASFAGSGLVAGAPSLAVLLGADVGTTLVAQMLSFDLSLLAPVLLFMGFALFSSSSSWVTSNIGRTVLGLGLMLLALKLIVAASSPIRESPIALSLLGSLEGEPVLGIVLGALITFLAHSSLASVLLVVSLGSVGVLSPEVAFALVLGANLGGALPPILATMGSVAEARRPPVGNLMLRFAGVIICLPLLGEASGWLEFFGSDLSQKIVNFHTAFNLMLAILFLPFVGPVYRLTARLIPDRIKNDEQVPHRLDAAAIDTPPVALVNASLEAMRMAEILGRMLREAFTALQQSDSQQVKKARDMDDSLDLFYSAIKVYLVDLGRKPLSDEESASCSNILSFITTLEHAGDVVAVNLLDNVASKKINNQIALSSKDQQELTLMHARLCRNLDLAMSVFMSGDPGIAHKLLKQKARYRQWEEKVADQHIARLSNKSIDAVASSALYMDIIHDLRRINSLLASVAYPFVHHEEKEVASTSSQENLSVSLAD